MKRPKSRRQILRELVRKHPDWSNKQLAAELDQSRDTIRGALSKMRIKLKVTLRPGRPKKD